MENKKLMLIADDLPLSREIMKKQFSDSYYIIEAQNGTDALYLMRKYADSLDIVILDIYMPGMNGFDVLEAAKNDDMLSDIPIIAVTSDESTEINALKAGAWDFIPKSFEPTILKLRIENAINLRSYIKATAEKTKNETKSNILHYLNDMPAAFIAVKPNTEKNDIILDYCNNSYLRLCNMPESSDYEYRCLSDFLAFSDDSFRQTMFDLLFSERCMKTRS